jgi:transmembrane sensor
MTDLARLDAMGAAQAAAYWLVKQDQGLDVTTDAGFAAWLGRAPANREAWTRAEAVWDGLDEPDETLSSLRRAALAVRPDRRPLWIAAAAAVATIVVGGAFGWRTLSPSPATSQSIALRIAAAVLPDHETEVGVQRALTLPDGTGVILDTNSAIAVRFLAGHRAVRLLRGRAFFNVAHDAAAPFAVSAGDRTITDVGTQFCLSETGRGVTVTLAQGRILVGGKGPPVALSAGQQLVASTGGRDVVASVDLDQALAWRDGFLEFRDEPLGQAFAEMNRYGRTPVVIRDPATSALRISGRFHTGDPAQFARSLTAIYPVKLVHGPSGDEIALER